MSAARRLALVAAIAAAGAGAATAPRAAAAYPVFPRVKDPPTPEEALAQAQDAVAKARALLRTAREVRQLLYWLSDPRGFQYELYATYDLLLRDPILGPLVENLASLYRGRTWTFTAQAHAMADSATPASAAVGASLVYEMPLCRVIDLSASGQVFYEDGEPDGAIAYGAGGCLPLPVGTFELGYRGRRAVRTSLLAVPVVDGDRQTGDTVYSSLRFWRWRSARHQIDVMPMSFNFDWARDDGATTFQTWSSFSPARWVRRGGGAGERDNAFDFVRIAFGTLGVQGDGVVDPLVATISPLVIDNLPWGDDVGWSLDLGWGFVEVGSDGTAPDLRRRLGHVDSAFTFSGDGNSLELRVKKSAQPTLEDQILDEVRLTARLDVERSRGWLRVDAFTSEARLIGARRYSERVTTYGAGGDLTIALTDHLFGYARAEAARAIAVDRIRAVPDLVTDVRGTIGVTTQVQKVW